MFDKSCTFTGHRPKRFLFGYDENDDRCVMLKAAMKKVIVSLVDEGVWMFYNGMALGVDHWAAEIVLDLKREQKNICLTAILPCETQANYWPAQSRDRYFNMLSRCDDVKTLHTRYTRGCMLERNRFLINNAGYLIAVYDGVERGGTAYTIKHAKEKERKIITIHPDTLEVQ